MNNKKNKIIITLLVLNVIQLSNHLYPFSRTEQTITETKQDDVFDFYPYLINGISINPFHELTSTDGQTFQLRSIVEPTNLDLHTRKETANHA